MVTSVSGIGAEDSPALWGLRPGRTPGPEQLLSDLEV